MGQQNAWQDPEITQINRLPTRATTDNLMQDDLSLNGEWKFSWYSKPGNEPSDFHEKPFGQLGWETIPVPSKFDHNNQAMESIEFYADYKNSGIVQD